MMVDEIFLVLSVDHQVQRKRTLGSRQTANTTTTPNPIRQSLVHQRAVSNGTSHFAGLMQEAQQGPSPSHLTNSAKKLPKDNVNITRWVHRTILHQFKVVGRPKSAQSSYYLLYQGVNEECTRRCNSCSLAVGFPAASDCCPSLGGATITQYSAEYVLVDGSP